MFANDARISSLGAPPAMLMLVIDVTRIRVYTSQTFQIHVDSRLARIAPPLEISREVQLEMETISASLAQIVFQAAPSAMEIKHNAQHARKVSTLPVQMTTLLSLHALNAVPHLFSGHWTVNAKPALWCSTAALNAITRNVQSAP